MIKHHNMKTYGDIVVKIHAFFTSASDDGSNQLHYAAALTAVTTGQEESFKRKTLWKSKIIGPMEFHYNLDLVSKTIGDI